MNISTPNSAFLVGIDLPVAAPRSFAPAENLSLEDSLSELTELARTAGLIVVGSSSQRLKTVHPGTLIGPGKVEEIRARALAARASLILFDDELTPGQQKNLEKIFGEELPVLDRTALILDIFAAHARTGEGKLQVELAQYTYRLPRLTRLWTHLARQAGGRRGGVGLRGPGETQLEMDKRTIRRTIARLEKELEAVRRARERQRDQRRSEGFFTVALAGYTNAGKSTLLNALSAAGLTTENKLFSTLDPTTRRVKLPGGLTVLFTDTVGFISKLPHNLVAAFRATFEEIGEADLILHLVDASHPQARLQQDIVERELKRTVLAKTPVLTVWNKLDRLDEVRRRPYSEGSPPEGVPPSPAPIGVSALTGLGLPRLLDEIERFFIEQLVRVTLDVPYAEGKILTRIQECGSHVTMRRLEKAVRVEAFVPRGLLEQVRPFLNGKADGDGDGDPQALWG